MKGPLFYSKILLFGEYGIIKDSKGLSIPYNFHKGALKSDHNPSAESLESNTILSQYLIYLKTLEISFCICSKLNCTTVLSKVFKYIKYSERIVLDSRDSAEGLWSDFKAPL